MSPPSDHPCLDLRVLPNRYFVLKLNPEDEIPDFAQQALKDRKSGRFFSITCTPEETSLVGEEFDNMPAQLDEVTTWRCIKIRGPMEFELVGVLASFTEPLKKAAVPVFAVSTWNTDWILIPAEKIELAEKALKEDGWKFMQE